MTELSGHRLVDPTLPELGTGSLRQEAWGLGTTLSFLTPLSRMWGNLGSFCPFPERTLVVPSAPPALCTPLAFLGVPASLGGPTAPSGGGARGLPSSDFHPPVYLTWP